jgi:hypothetical protein
MGKRAAMATTNEELSKLSLEELQGQIDTAKWKSSAAKNGSQRKRLSKLLKGLQEDAERFGSGNP